MVRRRAAASCAALFLCELLRSCLRRREAIGHRPTAQRHQPIAEGLRLLFLPGAFRRPRRAVIAVETSRRRTERGLVLGERGRRLPNLGEQVGELLARRKNRSGCNGVLVGRVLQVGGRSHEGQRFRVSHPAAARRWISTWVAQSKPFWPLSEAWISVSVATSDRAAFASPARAAPTARAK